MNKKLWPIIGILAAIVVVIIIILSIPKQPSALDEVRLKLDWKPGSEHAFYWYGLDKGYYAQEGLKLIIEPGEGSSVSTQMVGAGKSDFGIASGETVMIARSKEMPVVALAVLLQESPVVVYSLKEKGIEKPLDLIGKKLGTIIKSTAHPQLLVFLEKNSIDEDKLEIIPVSGAPEELLTGRIDALLGYSFNQPPALLSKGYQLNFIKLLDYGVDVYSMSILTNEEMIKTKPEIARKFMRATTKAIRESIKNKPMAVAAFMKYNPEADESYQKLKFDKIASLIGDGAEKSGGIGVQLEEGWRKTQDILLQAGLIDKEIRLADFFTNEFLG